jgi:pyrroline-5-carboxylate reductase
VWGQLSVGSLAILGGGKLGSALLQGLLKGGWEGSELAVVEVSEPQRAKISEISPEVTVVSSLEEIASWLGPRPLDGALLAVKPDQAQEPCKGLGMIKPHRVLSIMAGVKTETIRSWITQGGGKHAGFTPPVVMRAMPNRAAIVGAGVSALACDGFSTEDLAWARSILEGCGPVVEMPEELMDAATGLSGSGPAYVALVVEGLVEGGVAVGLSRSVAQQLAYWTLEGTARLLIENDESPASIRENVTSPGGTTAAGLLELEEMSVRAAFIHAVIAATQRARELGAD